MSEESGGWVGESGKGVVEREESGEWAVEIVDLSFNWECIRAK